MNYKVSILIPIYNAEKVIERCLRSVFEQTMNDIEYVLVNDCSRDNSYELCQAIINQYPQRRPHVTLLSNETNQGIAIVRETLVNHAHGEYIYFVDSDDWIEHEAAEIMYTKALEKEADVVGSNIFINTKTEQSTVTFNYPENNDECLNEFLRMNIKPVVWIFIFKRALFSTYNITFVRNINGVEDYIVGAKLLFHANKVAHVNKSIYHYTIGDNYYTPHSENYFNIMGQAIVEAEQYLRKHGDITHYHSALTDRKLIFKSKYLFENLTLDDKKYYETFPEANYSLRKFKLFSFKQSLIMVFAELRFHWIFILFRKFR